MGINNTKNGKEIRFHFLDDGGTMYFLVSKVNLTAVQLATQYDGNTGCVFEVGYGWILEKRKPEFKRVNIGDHGIFMFGDRWGGTEWRS